MPCAHSVHFASFLATRTLALERDYIVSTVSHSQGFLVRAVPPIAGVMLIIVFSKLGLWQLDRANQIDDMLKVFASPASYIEVSDTLTPSLYTAIEATGRYQPDTQILIDNVIVDGRLGYYVISALEFGTRAPLLLVNRGWIRKNQGEQDLPDITLGQTPVTVRGKSGRLPRVGIRPGVAFAEPGSWPRVGVWPTSEEVSAELDRDVLPFVLLLDADQPSGFVRKWQPQQSGPAKHYGYAFQWFAMAIAVLVIGAWRLRKRGSTDDG